MADEKPLKELLLAPAWTKTEEASVGERSVNELITADRYIRETERRSTSEGNAAPWGMTIARTVPGGTC